MSFSSSQGFRRGWVQSCTVEHASWCFASGRRGVETKGRRHVAPARKRPGFGGKRGRSHWLDDTMGLSAAYRITYRPTTTAASARDVSAPWRRRGQERVVREIRLRRARWRELETERRDGLRPRYTAQAVGNSTSWAYGHRVSS